MNLRFDGYSFQFSAKHGPREGAGGCAPTALVRSVFLEFGLFVPFSQPASQDAWRPDAFSRKGGRVVSKAGGNVCANSGNTDSDERAKAAGSASSSSCRK
jgi:hypothetical protein